MMQELVREDFAIWKQGKNKYALRWNHNNRAIIRCVSQRRVMPYDNFWRIGYLADYLTERLNASLAPSERFETSAVDAALATYQKPTVKVGGNNERIS